MKRNTIIAAGIALVLGCVLNNAQAQDSQTPAPAAPPAVVQPPAAGAAQQPAPGPRPMPPRMRQPRMFVQRALFDLKQVKAALEHSEGDLGGHKDSAIEACDKATAELDAVLKAMPMPAQGAGAPPRSSFQNNLNRIPPAGTPPPATAPAAPPQP